MNTLMNEWVQGLMALEPLSLTIRVSALLALALLAVRLQGRQPAARRFAVLVCALGSVTVLPLVSWIVPHWAILPNVVPAAQAPLASVEQPLTGTARTTPPTTATATRGARRATVASPSGQTRSTASPALNRGAGVLLAWLAGTLILSVRTLLSLRRLHGLRRQSVALHDAPWRALLADRRKRLGVARHVDLRLHTDPIMPMTFGLRSPVILLPLEAVSWDAARRSDVLSHELAHIRRHDLAYEWICQLACIVHWFNPLVWLARRALLSERERACDDLVLSTGADPVRYANCLLQTSIDYRACAAPAACMARPSELESRMLSIMDRQRRREALSRPQTAGVAAASVVALLATSSLAVDAPRVPPAPPQAAAPPAPAAAPRPAEPEAASKPAALPSPEQPPAPPAGIPEAQLFERYSSDVILFREEAVLDTDPSDGLTVYDLLDALRSASPLNRAAAARAMRDFDDPAVVPALVVALADRNEHVREWAARSLGAIGDEAALPALSAALNDTDGEVAEWAARGLGNLARPASADALVQALTHTNPAVREWSARALGRVGGTAATDSLIGTLQDADGDVREWAIRALGDLGDPAAIAPIAALADDPDEDVREWSERTVKRLRRASGD